MFLRFVLFVMMFSVVFARNLEQSQVDRVPSSGIPCSKEETSNHQRREIKQAAAAALNDNNSAASMIISAKNNDEHPYPLKTQLKKRAVTIHESHTPGPKPGCCG